MRPGIWPTACITICERKGRPRGLAYNSLVVAWPEITRLAREENGSEPDAEFLFLRLMMDDSIHGRRVTVAKTNYERVGKGLELLKEGLAPFVEREMKARYGAYWLQEAEKKLKQEKSWQGKSGQILLDVQALFILINQEWNDVFRKTLGHAERSLVSELRDVRNSWAHQQPFSTDDAYRALDSIERLLTAISAPQAPRAGNDEAGAAAASASTSRRAREPRKAAATAGAAGDRT